VENRVACLWQELPEEKKMMDAAHRWQWDCPLNTLRYHHAEGSLCTIWTAATGTNRIPDFDGVTSSSYMYGFFPATHSISAPIPPIQFNDVRRTDNLS